MKNTEVYSLENLLDRTKFADLDVALHYGDSLLKNINKLSRYIQIVIDEIGEYNPSENIMSSLKEAQLEVRMMQIAVTDMKSYLVGYKAATEPAKTEDIGATKEWGFTEEEIERAEKQKSKSTPEEKITLENYNEKNQQPEV